MEPIGALIPRRPWCQDVFQVWPMCKRSSSLFIVHLIRGVFDRNQQNILELPNVLQVIVQWFA